MTTKTRLLPALPRLEREALPHRRLHRSSVRQALRDAGLRHRKGREHLEAGGLCRGAARRVSHLHREAELTGLRALARHDAIARERQARGQLAAADGPRVGRGPTVSTEGDCLIHDPNLTVVEGKAGDREGGTSR